MDVSYSPVSILAYSCRIAASAAASANPLTAGVAAGVGEAAEALLNGYEIGEDQKNMQGSLLRAIDKAWGAVQKKYELTNLCMKDLKNEVMGRSTSTDAFIRNSQTEGLKPAIASVIESILSQHVDEFRRSVKHTWTVGYTKNASKDIADILISSIDSVFQNNDSLMVLKAIMDSDAKRYQEHQRINIKLDQIQDSINDSRSKDFDISQCLTPIPLIDEEVGLVGRDAVVGEIRKMLNENTCIVLVSGLGGIGKTAVMQGVCNDLKDDGHYVAWISCGDSLQDDLLMLRDALGIPKEEKAEEAYRLVKTGIQKLGKRLYLFMDDLSREVSKKERDAINELGIHVMITSRKENLPFRKKKLEYLADRDAIKMFYGYYGRETDCDVTAWKIIESVNCHTLLVELLAKAAREEGGTLNEFYEKLLKEGFFDVSEEELETEHDDENLTIEECVIKLYKISKLSEEQQRIMKLFTIFSPEKEIYYKIRDWAGFDRKELKKLVELGWLERGGLESGYQIHQIVRDSIARQMKKNGEKVLLEDYGDFFDKVIDTDNYLGIEVTYDKVRERLVLTEDVAMFFDEGGREDADTGALFNNLAGVYSDQSDYEKALEYYGKALAICERVLGLDHPDTATTYNNMAGVYEDQGDYEKALEYYGKDLAISERVLGPDHPNTATTYNNMALVYSDQGDYDKALEYYGKALAICERVLGTEHPDTATTYDNIANVYHRQDNYTRALEYHGKALAIRERVLGTEHPDTAMTYNNMASVYHEQGDYGKALKYYGKALTISERVLGTEHPGTAVTYNNMALVYKEQGNYEKALEYNGKALAIRERVLGRDHPDTATTYNNMALVYHAHGDYGKALEYYGKALAIKERMLGTDNLSMATRYNNMAWFYRKQSDFKKALYYYKKAYDIRLNKLGENHLDTKSTKRSIEIMESKMK